MLSWCGRMLRNVQRIVATSLDRGRHLRRVGSTLATQPRLGEVGPLPASMDHSVQDAAVRTGDEIREHFLPLRPGTLGVSGWTRDAERRLSCFRQPTAMGYPLLIRRGVRGQVKSHDDVSFRTLLPALDRDCESAGQIGDGLG